VGACALVTTGKHRYASDGRYVAARRQLLLTVRTSGGVVRLQATLGAGSVGAARMLGIWSDAHGDESDVDRLSPRTTLAGLRACDRAAGRVAAVLPAAFLDQDLRQERRVQARAPIAVAIGAGGYAGDDGASAPIHLITCGLAGISLGAMQGTTARAPQFTGTGFATPPYGADVATNQRTMPRWMGRTCRCPVWRSLPSRLG